jgi:hypothetical protein
MASFEYFNHESSYANSSGSITPETEAKIESFRARNRRLAKIALEKV